MKVEEMKAKSTKSIQQSITSWVHNQLDTCTDIEQAKRDIIKASEEYDDLAKTTVRNAIKSWKKETKQ